jgi:hypothetical protein
MIYKKEKRRLGTTELDKPHQLTTHFIRARMTRFCFYSFFEKKIFRDDISSVLPQFLDAMGAGKTELIVFSNQKLNFQPIYTQNI